MITVVHVSLAIYPLEKHFQTENETGQLPYANIGCAISATTLVVRLEWTLSSRFKSERTEARRIKVKSPGLERRLSVSHIPRPPILEPSCRGAVSLGGSRMFPGVQFVFPIAGGGACGQGGIAISEDFVGFALK